LDLGAGKDVMYLIAPPPGSSVQVQAGVGLDQLGFGGDSADYLFDLGTGVVTRSGVETALLSGFEDYQLSLPDKTGGLGVLGTSGADKLTLSAVRLDLHLGDGPDSVVLPRLGRWNQAGVIDLGAGEDSLEAVARRVVGDLAQGRLVLRNSGGHKHQGRLALLGVERLLASGAEVVMRRGPEADWLSSNGCNIQMRGGTGPDHLAARSIGQPRCSADVVGGAGPDHLLGGGADDRLMGGPGNDEARGGGGTDTCRAEREFSCEG
jgi:Ca2+-binding RTX toxin-like protein